MKERDTYLAIALTTYCNYRCFYCKEGGESICCDNLTISFLDVRKVISNAYDVGIRNFRITGGEPTTVSYLGKLIIYIMNFPDSKIRINTNGYRILEVMEEIIQYKNRIDIIFSVDSISEHLNGCHFPKFLSEDIIEKTKILKQNNISVRYNVVVTKLNQPEIRQLVLKAVDELNVNVKLLDLNKFSEYL